MTKMVCVCGGAWCGTGRESDKRKGGGVILRQNSNFRESFVTKAVNSPMAYRDTLCEEGGNQERKISFCRRLLTCGIQAFAQCQVTTTHSSKQRGGHSHYRGSGVRARLSIRRLKKQEESHSKRGHGQGIYLGAQTISGGQARPTPPTPAYTNCPLHTEKISSF